jgi:hypothetical protein
MHVIYLVLVELNLYVLFDTHQHIRWMFLKPTLQHLQIVFIVDTILNS